MLGKEIIWDNVTKTALINEPALVFEDSNLEAIVRAAINKPYGKLYPQ